MSVEAGYRSALIEYIRQEAQPVDKFSHQPRLYQLAREIGGSAPYDDDVLFAAAWIHDLGVFYGHRPSDAEELARWDNVIYAMERAPEVLTRLQFPIEKMAAVVEAVRTHQPSGEPTSFEALLLRDADILEQLGAIGILRMVSKIGRDTRYPAFASALETLRKALDRLPAQLRTEKARELAGPKIQILEAFLSAAQEEGRGHL